MTDLTSNIYRKIVRYIAGVLGLLVIVVLLIAGLIYLNRNKINNTISGVINTHIRGDFNFDGVSFMPFYKGIGVTFIFREVEVIDNVTQQPVLKVERLGIRVSPAALWNEKQLKVTAVMFEKGQLSMLKTAEGYSNLKTFGKSKDKKAEIELKYTGIHCAVLFDQMQISYYDSTKIKYYAADFKDVDADIRYNNGVMRCSINGNIYYNGLVFNEEKGAFLKEKNTQTNLEFDYNVDDRELVLNSGKIVLDERYPVKIEGAVQLKDSLKGKSGHYHFEFTTHDIPAKTALSQLPKTLDDKISKFKILPIVDSQVTIDGKFNQNKPFLEVRFVTDTFQFAVKNIMLNQLRATGYYTSQYDKTKPPSDSNSVISCSRIDGFFEKFPLRGDMKIVNLISPDAHVNFDLKASMYNINAMLDPELYTVKEGEFRLIGRYDGNLKPLYDVQNDSFNGKISGNLTIRNLRGEYLRKNVKINNLNADIRFDEKKLSVQRMTFVPAEKSNILNLDGQVTGLIASLLGSEKPVKGRVDFKIKDWKLNWIEELTGKNNVKPQTKPGANLYKLSEWIDRSIGKLELQTFLNAGKLTYQQFVAKDVTGELMIYPEKVDLKYFSLRAFDGFLKIGGSLSGLGYDQTAKFDLHGTVKDADVKKVFYSLGNFGQSTLTDKNLEGILQANFQLKADLNNDASIVFPSVKGKLQFNLTDGKIKNFEPFLKIKKLVFKNRNLEDVQFQPLQANVDFVGEEILVNNLDVKSNVLTFSIGGVYSFGNKTNLSIKIPVSNFKNERNNRKQASKNNQKSIYLKAIDQNGSVNIMLDGKRSLK